MLVRVLGLASIILGALIWAEHAQFLATHILLGFLVSIAVFILAVVAITKKAVMPGILGLVFSFVVPLVGFLQLPLTFHGLRLIQAVHIMVALSIIGIAERLYSAIRAK
jgi:hypothetical protein